jgi:hypothetical protein
LKGPLPSYRGRGAGGGIILSSVVWLLGRTFVSNGARQHLGLECVRLELVCAPGRHQGIGRRGVSFFFVSPRD